MCWSEYYLQGVGAEKGSDSKLYKWYKPALQYVPLLQKYAEPTFEKKVGSRGLPPTASLVVRPVVPLNFRRIVMDKLHNLSHPGFKPTHDLISRRFVWPGMRKGC